MPQETPSVAFDRAMFSGRQKQRVQIQKLQAEEMEIAA
jgi:hypothetical protein